jgi:hypothetical protein
MNAKSLSILLASSILLGGCTTLGFGPSVDPIEVKTVAVAKEPLSLPDPRVVKPKNVEWFIITPENVEEVLAELSDKGYDVVLYGLTDDGYENLSMNMAQLRAYIVQQKEIIRLYREYYEPEKEIVE